MPSATTFTQTQDSRDTASEASRRHLSALRLLAYTADAARVLSIFQRHADASPAFDQMLRRACADWRNPGSMDDPMDLISETLAAMADALSHALEAEARL